VSFTVGHRLIVLLEHQSTINRNMPLRLLMYAARCTKRSSTTRSCTRPAQYRPVFIVLYNGKDPYPEHTILKLSDAFMDTAGLRAKNPDGQALELVVHVYNINQGYNAAMLEKCETLSGYSVLVSKIWEFRRTMGLEDAMKSAIRYC